jgi:hypothetical protein
MSSKASKADAKEPSSSAAALNSKLLSKKELKRLRQITRKRLLSLQAKEAKANLLVLLSPPRMKRLMNILLILTHTTNFINFPPILTELHLPPHPSAVPSQHDLLDTAGWPDCQGSQNSHHRGQGSFYWAANEDCSLPAT